MGKKGKTTRFIDPKKDVITRFALSRKQPEPTEAAAPESNEKSVSSKKIPKKVMFQLRCDVEAADSNNSIQSEAASSTQKESSNINSVEDEHFNQLGPQSTEDLLGNAPEDLSQYGIFYNDGYDYSQHLRSLEDTQWTGCTDVQEVVQLHPQQLKKERKMKQQLAQLDERDVELYVPPPKDDFALYQEEFGDGDEGELSDDFMAMLVGSGEAVDEDDSEGDVEVDYSKMPPLEDDIDTSRMDEDCESITSSNCMEVSDDENEDNGVDFANSFDAEFPTLAAAAKVPLKKPKEKYVCEDFKGQTYKLKDFNEKFGGEEPSEQEDESDDEESRKAKLDRFFDAVAEESDEEKEPQLQPMPAMQSSRGVKPIAEPFQMINDQFDAMLARDYQDLSLAGGEDVEGCLPENAPQFMAACRNKQGWDRNQLVAMVGPNKERETSDEISVRNQAIEYSKKWRETKEPLIEVCIPDPRAMKYDVTKLPSNKNKNMPAIIYTGSLLRKKKKKGLSINALKQHDLEMNTPHRDVEEETQTYKTMLTELSYRPLGEKPEERRERKIGIKELRKGRREEKKMNKLAHKDIMLLTTRVNMNAKHCKSISMI